MPKTAATEFEVQNRRTRAAITHNQELYDVTDQDIAKAMNCTVKTVQNKKNKPWIITMTDIRLFCKILKLTDEQIVELIGVKNSRS